MEEVSTIGLDIAKPVFQAHGADGAGRQMFSQQLTRAKVLPFFAPQVLSVQCEPVSTWRVGPNSGMHQAANDCHSARAAERRSLYVMRSTRWRSELKWLCSEAWTETNFCSDFIWRNRSIARSRRRKGRCEFSARLLSQRPISLRSRLPISRIAAG